MPTLAEIANQINNTLSEIDTNTQDTATTAGLIKGDTADIKARLDTIEGTLVSGFGAVELGLFGCLEALKAADSLLKINAEQNETIICWLSTIGDLLCRQLRVMERELVVETAAKDAIVKTEQIIERVHPGETLDVDRDDAVAAKMAACCPEPTPDPGPCYKPCEERRSTPYTPKGQDWTPPRQTGTDHK